MGKIASALGANPAAFQKVLDGKEPAVDQAKMELVVKAALSIGATATVCLGWEDTQGFHMVGVGGGAAAGLNVGCNIFAGKHKSGKTVKVKLGITNFEFEYVMPIPPNLIKQQGGYSPAVATAPQGSSLLD